MDSEQRENIQLKNPFASWIVYIRRKNMRRILKISSTNGTMYTNINLLERMYNPYVVLEEFNLDPRATYTLTHYRGEGRIALYTCVFVSDLDPNRHRSLRYYTRCTILWR